MSSERQLIERVRRAIPSRAGGGVYLGIGDDAAILRPERPSGSRKPQEWVVTTDAFLENTHFTLKTDPADSVGYKALARATSDLAAMGALPECFFMNLAIPQNRTGRWLDEFLKGMARAARSLGLTLAGGDTSRQAQIAINLMVLGTVASGRTVLRSGAKPGDVVYVSGRLGQAALGLKLTELGLHKQGQWKRLLDPHFYPQPRLALGQFLAGSYQGNQSNRASSMIDISDGLSSDLQNLCEASRTGASIWRENIPEVDVPEELRKFGIDPLQLALDGGDDYELLFTVPQKVARRLPRKLGGVSLTAIGKITREKKIVLVDRDGRIRPIPARGWDSFATRNKTIGP